MQTIFHFEVEKTPKLKTEKQKLSSPDNKDVNTKETLNETPKNFESAEKLNSSEEAQSFTSE